MLIVGTNKDPILELLPDNFLLIDDGGLIDALPNFGRRKLTFFNHLSDTFNPLKAMSYTGARDFLTILDAIFPEGANTLTKKNSNFVLLNALLDRPTSLDKLILPSQKDPAQQDAYQKIQTLLLSPVLNRVLLKKANFSLKGVVIARLDPTELGEFDCFALGNFLMQQYKGTIIIPDYGFYAAPHHSQLIREDRIIAGINYLDELSAHLKSLFLLRGAVPSHCLPDDAETLAIYAHKQPGTLGFTDYIRSSING